jgi:hypothetical protein
MAGDDSRRLGAMARAKRKLPAAVELGHRGNFKGRQEKTTPAVRAESARQASLARWAQVSPEERTRLGRRAARACWAKAKRKKDVKD